MTSRESPFESRRRKQSVEARVDEEIRFHIESRVDELVAAGHSVDAAHRQALREFGDPEAARAELVTFDRTRLHQRRLIGGIVEFWRDLRHVVRSLCRQPGFSIVVVVTLALAIGANAAVFGIVDRLLLRGPEHVRNQERIARLYGHMNSPSQGSRTTDVFGYVTYTDLRDHAKGLDRVAAYATSSVIVSSGIDAHSVRVGYGTWDFFPLLGVAPEVGRFFDREEDLPPRGSDVVVLGHGYWRREFGGARDAIGKTMSIGGSEFTVVGVAPAGFTGVELEPVELWLPMTVRSRNMRADWPTTRHSSWLRIVARLGRGVTWHQASEEVASIHTQRATAGAPEEMRSRARLELLPLGRDRAGNEPPEVAVARWLVGVAAIVLLIAVTNVSSLQLARASGRKREVAVRLALGIDRGRLFGLFLMESLVLAAVGTMVGLLVAHLGSGVIRTVLLPQVAWTKPPISNRVLLFSVLVSVTVGMAVGMVPGLTALRTELIGSLKTGTREGGGRAGAFRTLVLIGQSALALMLLVGAGLFVRSLDRIRQMDVGFEPDRVVSVDVWWPSVGRVPAEERASVQAVRDQFASDARDRFVGFNWVESASLSIGLPFHSSFGVDVRLPGRDSLPPLAGEGPSIAGVSPEYFATVGARLMDGRLFNSADVSGSEPVTIVNQTMARSFWPEGNSVGRCLILYDDPIPCVRVVGIVQDAKQWSLLEVPALQFYVPIAQAREISGAILLVRPVGDAGSRLDQIRSELIALRPDLPYVSIGPIQRWIDPQVRPWRMGAILFSLFGLLALVVAASGLYSTLAYLVERRRQEFGIRCALGASGGRILIETVRRGLMPSVIGLVVGGLLALVLGTRLQPQLYETSARDPLVFGVATGVLFLVAVLGALLPAQRAAEVDPVVTLREE